MYQRQEVETMTNYEKFKDELIKKRMEVAKFLINSGTMSLSDIGHYVGYNSYVGFWKALTAYNNANHSE
jgi:YesN/AraC family two-component response regulator